MDFVIFRLFVFAGEEEIDYNMSQARTMSLGNGVGPGGGVRNSTQVTIPKDVSLILCFSRRDYV